VHLSTRRLCVCASICGSHFVRLALQVLFHSVGVNAVAEVLGAHDSTHHPALRAGSGDYARKFQKLKIMPGLVWLYSRCPVVNRFSVPSHGARRDLIESVLQVAKSRYAWLLHDGTTSFDDGIVWQVQNPQFDPFKIRAGARRVISVSTEDGFGLSIEIFFFISESLVFSQNRVPLHITPHLASARPLMNGCVRYWKQ